MARRSVVEGRGKKIVPPPRARPNAETARRAQGTRAALLPLKGGGGARDAHARRPRRRRRHRDADADAEAPCWSAFEPHHSRCEFEGFATGSACTSLPRLARRAPHACTLADPCPRAPGVPPTRALLGEHAGGARSSSSSGARRASEPEECRRASSVPGCESFRKADKQVTPVTAVLRRLCRNNRRHVRWFPSRRVGGLRCGARRRGSRLRRSG